MRCRARSLREYHLRSYVKICRERGLGMGWQLSLPLPAGWQWSSKGKEQALMAPQSQAPGAARSQGPMGIPPCPGSLMLWEVKLSWSQQPVRNLHSCLASMHPHTYQGSPSPGQAHLEVLQTQLAAEKLMLLPHVLLQVPEEAEGRQLGALRALMLQQLPRETPEPPTMPDTHCCCSEQGHSPGPHLAVRKTMSLEYKA